MRKKHCDGAVTCALLATECALKATLLFGSGVKYHHELAEAVRRLAFEGKTGQDLDQLWRLQPPRIRDATPPLAEVHRLHGHPRYEHRYGYRRPRLPDAQLVVDDAKMVVQWMKRVVS